MHKKVLRILILCLCILGYVGVAVLVGTIFPTTHPYHEITRKLEFEAFNQDGAMCVKGSFLEGIERHMRVVFSGGFSQCTVSGRHGAAALLDVRGNLVRANIERVGNPAGGVCKLDLKFLFRRFRMLVMSHSHVTFIQRVIGPDEGMQCMITPNMGRSLCETRHQGIAFHWFSENDDFYEKVASVEVATGSPGHPVVVKPSIEFSQRTPAALIDVPMAVVLRETDVHFDIVSRRILFVPRHPTRLGKEITSVIGAMVAVFFVVRLMKDTTQGVPVYHWFVVCVSILGIAVAIATQARCLQSPMFVTIVIVATVIHLGAEVFRFTTHRRACKRRLRSVKEKGHEVVGLANDSRDSRDSTDTNEPKSRTTTTTTTTKNYDVDGVDIAVMNNIDIKPDMGIILTSLVLCMYTISSHSLVIIPALIAVFVSVKMVSELMNSRWISFGRANRAVFDAVYIVCLVTDISLSLALWRYVVWEFTTQTIIAPWYLQDTLLILITVGGGSFLAKTRFDSTICHRIRVTDALASRK
jgi:hypothetical protein